MANTTLSLTAEQLADVLVAVRERVHLAQDRMDDALSAALTEHWAAEVTRWDSTYRAVLDQWHCQGCHD